MISFFRKIRQSLLTENKVTRYLIYVLGEIILVLIWKSSPFRDLIRVEQTKNQIPPCL
jgi:hypothetical protein